MTIKLFTIGDSISQGYMSGAAAWTDLAYSSLIAAALGVNKADYLHPEWPVGGMSAPANLEAIFRRLVQRYGNDIKWLEWATALLTINEVLQEAEEYYERGAGNFELGYVSADGKQPEFFHNVAVEGFKVADAWLVTPELCKHEIIHQGGNPSRNDMLGGPSSAFYRIAHRVLNPQNKAKYMKFSALDWLKEHVKGKGVENLILWLGANNALGSIVDFEIRYTPNDNKNRPSKLSHFEREARGWNLWHPDDFEVEYQELLDRVDEIMQNNIFPEWKVFIATIPTITIAPYAKGVGSTFKIEMDWGYINADGKKIPDKRERTYYKYYTLFPLEEDYAAKGGKHLSQQQAVFIDNCIIAYNGFIKRSIEKLNNKHNNRYYCVDMADTLDKIAYKRNEGKVQYEFPEHFKFAYPPVNTKYYHANASGQLMQGGLVGLDGIHPSAIAHGIIAHEFLKVMKDKAKIEAKKDLDWPTIFASDTLYQKPISLMHEIYEHEMLLKLLLEIAPKLFSKVV